MFLQSYLNREKIARFIAAVRQEGWRAAFCKLRAYVAMRRAGYGRSALPDPGHAPAPHPEQHLNAFWREIARKEAFHVSQPPAATTRRRRITMIGDLNLPQCRKYRVEQLAELWQAHGVEYDYSHYEDVPRAISLLEGATHLMLYRTQNGPLNSMYLYEARRLRLPVLYDLDDPLFSVSAYETYENMKALPEAMKAHFVAEAPRYLDAMNMADIVTVSTPGMREHARLYTNRPVFFRRNFADSATFAAADAALARTTRDPQAPFRVAFASGSQGHEMDFAVMGDEMAEFLAADPNRQLVILGHFNPELLPEKLRGQAEVHPFTDYDGYLAALATVDCAVMPLTDDAFNRCKSAVRVIDAAAVAVPSIVTTIGDMANVVRDRETGRVLQPGDSWRAALEAMAEDRAATAELGRAARADLERRWRGDRDGLPVIEPEILKWVLE